MNRPAESHEHHYEAHRHVQPRHCEAAACVHGLASVPPPPTSQLASGRARRDDALAPSTTRSVHNARFVNDGTGMNVSDHSVHHVYSLRFCCSPPASARSAVSSPHATLLSVRFHRLGMRITAVGWSVVAVAVAEAVVHWWQLCYVANLMVVSCVASQSTA
jgi:hypothetical protein